MKDISIIKRVLIGLGIILVTVTLATGCSDYNDARGKAVPGATVVVSDVRHVTEGS